MGFLFRGWRQQIRGAQIGCELSVVVVYIIGQLEDGSGAWHFAPADEGDAIAHLGIIELHQAAGAESERGFHRGDQIVFLIALIEFWVWSARVRNQGSHLVI